MATRGPSYWIQRIFLGSDGHRRLLRHEGVSYSLCFGPPLNFLTPNLADKLMPMLLLANGQCIDLNVSEPTMPSRATMQKRLAADPVAQARAFEIMMVLFFIVVLGVRPECVSNQRGEPWKGVREWASDGCAASSFYLGILGAVLAFRGPIESQGRGSLHPHVLVWLVSWCLQRIFDALLRDKAAFQERIRIWQAQCIAAIMSVTQSSVEQLPARFGFHESEHWGPAVPWTRQQHEEFTLASSVGEKYTPQCSLVMPCPRDSQELLPRFPTEHKLFDAAREGSPLNKTCTGFASSSVPQYRRCSSADALSLVSQKRNPDCMAELESHVMGALSDYFEAGNDFERSFLYDAWRLVLQCHIHRCGPSCYKYNSGKKKAFLCRHYFYHVVRLIEEAAGEKGAKRRRLRAKSTVESTCAVSAAGQETFYRLRGKELYNRVSIANGRVYTWQTHAYEGKTNYCGLAALRCNLDVQDLRRVLPGLLGSTGSSVATSWLPLDLPCLGPMQRWGWMDKASEVVDGVLQAVSVSSGLDRPAIDWREVLLSMMDLEPPAPDDPNVEAVRGMLAIVWREAHNAGFYTNSYTTKVNPTMDFFLGKLRAAIQKLHASWEKAAEERQRQKLLGESLPAAKTLPQKAVQVLMRMKGAYDASTHKSACELAFPILFGHLSMSIRPTSIRATQFCEVWAQKAFKMQSWGGQ